MEDPKLVEKVNGDKAGFPKSAYFQMRALVRDLKPNFLEVLKDPEFKKSNAAREVREKMDQLMELYKQAVAETDIATKSSAPMDNNTTPKQVQDGRTMMPPTRLPGKPHSEDFRIPGTYVVGGSAFGWNFITFPGNQAVYYGMTKEAFRATQAIFS
ncbi:hypothetical protein QQ045_030174 [Rhodiola kirilowii]